MPVPFPYFHALTVLLVFNLGLINYALVATVIFEWYLTLIVYGILCLFFLGLREVAICMSDPFGDDDVDFNLEPMLKGAWINAIACLKDNHAPCGLALGNLTNPTTQDNPRFTVAPGMVPALAPGQAPSRKRGFSSAPSHLSNGGTYPEADVEMGGRPASSSKMNDKI